jgi:hypothetical protein
VDTDQPLRSFVWSSWLPKDSPAACLCVLARRPGRQPLEQALQRGRGGEEGEDLLDDPARRPYTGRFYDLRGIPPGGLTRDVDTGRLFRKP